MHAATQLDRAARAHHGLLTLDDWTTAGNSRAAWFRLHGLGLIGAGPGVARPVGVAKTPEQRIFAAVLGADDAVASHRSAAYLWGVDIVGDDPVDLIVGRKRRFKQSCVEIHRPRDLADLRPVPRRGIPTTNPMRTLLDLGAVVPSEVKPAVEQLLIIGTVNVAGITRTLYQHRKKGRAGVIALQTALEELNLGVKPPDSVLEIAMSSLFERHAITGWTFHEVIGGMEVDFAFSGSMVVIEVDGWSSRATKPQFERDRERDAELGALGWLVLRFTWKQVTRRPSWVASRIEATLASRAGLLGAAGRNGATGCTQNG